MNDIKGLFQGRMRVIERLDNLNHPCGFDVVMRVPDTVFPEHDEYICSLPDGTSSQQRQMAELITAIPEMLDRLGDHCEWCADCDWENKPDLSCRFGQLWKRLRGEMSGSKKEEFCPTCHGSGHMKSYCDSPDPICPSCGGSGVKE